MAGAQASADFRNIGIGIYYFGGLASAVNKANAAIKDEVNHLSHSRRDHKSRTAGCQVRPERRAIESEDSGNVQSNLAISIISFFAVHR